jgi:FixJ family two-component response regulator
MNPKKILIVDDELDVRTLLSAYLNSKNYEACSVESAEEALDVFEPDNHSVVIVDLKMPGIGGMELTRLVKEMSPATIVIILTGYADMGAALQAIHLGCDDFLIKPLEKMDLLLLSVERCLKRQNSMMQAAICGKVSKIKNDVLRFTLDELENRLAELNDCKERYNLLEHAELDSINEDLQQCITTTENTLHCLGTFLKNLENRNTRILNNHKELASSKESADNH